VDSLPKSTQLLEIFLPLKTTVSFAAPAGRAYHGIVFSGPDFNPITLDSIDGMNLIAWANHVLAHKKVIRSQPGIRIQ